MTSDRRNTLLGDATRRHNGRERLTHLRLDQPASLNGRAHVKASCLDFLCEINQVSKLLAFRQPLPSTKSFPRIHHMAVSLPVSYTATQRNYYDIKLQGYAALFLPRSCSHSTLENAQRVSVQLRRTGTYP